MIFKVLRISRYFYCPDYCTLILTEASVCDNKNDNHLFFTVFYFC